MGCRYAEALGGLAVVCKSAGQAEDRRAEPGYK